MLKNKISGSISVGATQSGIIQTNEYCLAGMVFSSSVVTGSQVSFLVSVDGTNFYSLFDNTNTEVTVPVTACSKAYSLNLNAFKAWNYAKLRLGFSGSSKAQATYPLYVDFIAVQY